jgi:hypothetical protein
MRINLDWRPYLDAAVYERDYGARLAAYADLARRHFDADRFEEFCARHLAHLDAVADEFFASPAARAAVRAKVEALYPAHEVEGFTELFWQRIQQWRRAEAGG